MFTKGDRVKCCDDSKTERNLAHGWNYKILDVHPSGCVQVNDDVHVLGVQIFWNPSRFQRTVDERQN